jgi:Protein of unknown function (DUF3108)
MRIGLLGALGSFLWQAPAFAQQPAIPAPAPPTQMHFEMYAAGIHIANVDTEFAVGDRNYQMHTEYHTTGLASLFNHALIDNNVTGLVTGNAVRPERLFVHGVFRGEQRLADIDFARGSPLVLQLLPADTNERGPVPPAMLAGSMDNLSAMVNLMHTVATTGACNISARIYDGHKVTDFETRTGGMDNLGPYHGSMFTGPALRCDFVGTVIAGAKIDDPADGRQTHGSTWLARLNGSALPQPVRMSLETRWFGDAVMYLMSSQRVPGPVVAR